VRERETITDESNLSSLRRRLLGWSGSGCSGGRRRYLAHDGFLVTLREVYERH
jgi:hypothetical protein